MTSAVTVKGVVASVIVLVVAVACVRLGFWQLDRLEQRRARNALVEQRTAAAVLEGAGALRDTAGLAFRRVRVAGRLDRERAMLLSRQYYRGAPGVHVLVPLLPASGAPAVLLDLGWLSSPDAAHADLSRVPLPDTLTVVGLALHFPDAPRAERRGDTRVDTLVAPRSRTLFRLDPRTLAERLPYGVAPMYVRALPEPGAPEVPRRAEPPALGEGPHFGYALQWFGFAAVAVIGWGVMVLRRGRDDELRQDN